MDILFTGIYEIETVYYIVLYSFFSMMSQYHYKLCNMCNFNWEKCAILPWTYIKILCLHILKLKATLQMHLVDI